MAALLTPPIYVTAGIKLSPFLNDNDREYFTAWHDLEKTILAAEFTLPINVTPPATPPKTSPESGNSNDNNAVLEGQPRISITLDTEAPIHAPLAQRVVSNRNSILDYSDNNAPTETKNRASPIRRKLPGGDDRYHSGGKEDLLDVGHQIRSKTHDPAWRLSLASISDAQEDPDVQEKPVEKAGEKCGEILVEEHGEKRVQKLSKSPRPTSISFYETCVIPGCLVNYGTTESSGVHYATHLNSHISSADSHRKKVGATLLEKYLHQAFSPKVAKRLLARATEISLDASVRYSVELQNPQKRRNVSISSSQSTPTAYTCIVPACTAQLQELPSLYRHYLAHIRTDGKGDLLPVTFDELSAYFSEFMSKVAVDTTVATSISRMPTATSIKPTRRVESVRVPSTGRLSFVETRNPRLSVDSRRAGDIGVTGGERKISRKPVPPQAWDSSRVTSAGSSFDMRPPRPASMPLRSNLASLWTPRNRMSEVIPRSVWDSDDDDEVTLVQSIKTSFRTSRVFSIGNGTTGFSTENGTSRDLPAGNETQKGKGRKRFHVLERLKGFWRSGRFSSH